MNGHQRNKAGNRGEKPLRRGAGRQPPLSGRRVCRERDPAGWGRSAVLSARKPDGRDPEASGLVRGSAAWYTVCFAGGGGGGGARQDGGATPAQRPCASSSHCALGGHARRLMTGPLGPCPLLARARV